jgi:hypothetical protein
MAVRKSKTVSRRSAVVALGASVIGSTVAAGAQAPKTPPQTAPAGSGPTPLNTKNCVGRNTVTGFGNARERKQLQLQTCCVYLKDVLEHGHGNSQQAPRQRLQEFMDLLADEARRDALLDYCYVQFDLTEAEVKRFSDFGKRLIEEAPAKK